MFPVVKWAPGIADQSVIWYPSYFYIRVPPVSFQGCYRTCATNGGSQPRPPSMPPSRPPRGQGFEGFILGIIMQHLRSLIKVHESLIHSHEPLTKMYERVSSARALLGNTNEHAWMRMEHVQTIISTVFPISIFQLINSGLRQAR